MRNRNDVKLVIRGWLDLLKFSFTFPFRPSLNRSRKLLIASEQVRTSLPTAFLDRLIGEVPDTTVMVAKALGTRRHNCSLFELCTLSALVATRKPKKIIEIGTFDGRSALAMAANLPEDGKIYTLNLPPDFVAGKSDVSIDASLSLKVESGHRWYGMPESQKIEQVFANSLNFDFTQIGLVQMAFIDGDHTEKAVISDASEIKKIIDRNNGIILFHDATRYGVRPALEKMMRRGDKIFLIAGTSIAAIVYRDGEQLALW